MYTKYARCSASNRCCTDSSRRISPPPPGRPSPRRRRTSNGNSSSSSSNSSKALGQIDGGGGGGSSGSRGEPMHQSSRRLRCSFFAFCFHFFFFLFVVTACGAAAAAASEARRPPLLREQRVGLICSRCFYIYLVVKRVVADVTHAGCDTQAGVGCATFPRRKVKRWKISTANTSMTRLNQYPPAFFSARLLRPLRLTTVPTYVYYVTGTTYLHFELDPACST